MVKTAGRGSRGHNAGRGSTSQGGGGRGQGGRRSRIPVFGRGRGRGSFYHRRNQNPNPRIRPNGFLTALLGPTAQEAHTAPDHRTGASGHGSSSRMLVVGGNHNTGLAAICEAVDYIESVATSTSTSTTRDHAAMPSDVRKEAEVRTNIATPQDDEPEEGEIVEDAVEEEETEKYILPDLNFPPPQQDFDGHLPNEE